MLQGQKPQLYSTLQVGSPPPTLACPFCPRHFHSKGGRTKHIRAKHRNHADGPNAHWQPPNQTLTPPLAPGVPSPSHSSSHNIQFEQPPSPISSDAIPSSPIPPSYGGVDAANFADIGIDAEFPQFDRDYVPPDLNAGNELPVNEDLPPGLGDNPINQHRDAPHPPHITYIYHPKLNGK